MVKFKLDQEKLSRLQNTGTKRWKIKMGREAGKEGVTGSDKIHTKPQF